MYNFTTNHLLLLLNNELSSPACKVLPKVLQIDTELRNKFMELQSAWTEVATLEIEPSAGCLKRLQNALNGKEEMV